MTIDKVRFDERGLVPAVVQDALSGEVLMLAYMNRESLDKTIATGETHFWSRSRGELWHKGATSGHTQKVTGMSLDCDGDTILVRVLQTGAACHTGAYSCFFEKFRPEAEGTHEFALGEVLGAVARVIHQRNIDRPEGSYTTKLLEGGLDRILKKVGEESGEVIIAAKNHAPVEITWEVADLLYHLLVMMEVEGVSLADIAGKLGERRGGK
ncbi:MAG: bifunctional phosphoribosyl-AMP cyclohydrolase/phosphoribosyl-ATP diphosphatase HisIE [Ignavibacteriae bacterium]|nr:bifunctional phosphoribosyl-AMP cyclohydrolase/phosphoribosyl-ATP diphosphatase HisIE [Ignavibacteriota bacterium]